MAGNIFDIKKCAEQNDLEMTVKSFLNHCYAHLGLVPRIHYETFRSLAKGYCAKKSVLNLSSLSEEDLTDFADVLGEFFGIYNGRRAVLRDGLMAIYETYHPKSKLPELKTPSALEELAVDIPVGACASPIYARQ